MSEPPVRLVRYACKFCACLYGLKGEDVPALPQTQREALLHVESVHGYPERSAQAILGNSDSARLAARTIEQTSAIWCVTYLPDSREIELDLRDERNDR